MGVQRVKRDNGDDVIIVTLQIQKIKDNLKVMIMIFFKGKRNETDQYFLSWGTNLSYMPEKGIECSPEAGWCQSLCNTHEST